MTTSTAITLPNDLPAPALEIIPAPLVDRHLALLAEVAALPVDLKGMPIIADAAAHQSAERLLLTLAAVEKEIETAIEARSKPVHTLHKAILAVGKKAAEPVAKAKADLRTSVGAWNREQQRLRDEALAKAEAERLAAEAAAEKERARLQAEANAKHAAEVAAAEAVRKKAQDEADAAAAAERTRLQVIAEQEAKDLADVLGTPVAVEEVKVVAEVVAAPVVAAAPVVEVKIAAPVVVVPPPVKSAVVQRKVPTLVIDDETLVPAYVNGQQLRTLDRAAIKRAIDGGVVVPGARVEMVDSDAMRSVRA